MLCVNSEEDNNSAGDGSMRDGVNAGDRWSVNRIQLVAIFIKYLITTFSESMFLGWSDMCSRRYVKFGNFISVN